MPMEYIVLSMCIAAAMGMDDEEALEEWLDQLVQLKEDLFVACFHQHIEKDWEKAWHDFHIKEKQF